MRELFPSALLFLAASVVYAQDGGTLPVFRVQAPDISATRADELLKFVFDGPKYTVNKTDTTYIYRSVDAAYTLELDTLSGGLWLMDETRLWNASLLDQKFPPPEKAAKLADAYVKKFGLLPPLAKPFAASLTGTSSTQLSQEVPSLIPGRYTRKEFQLDVSAHFEIIVQLPGIAAPIPLVGGGGKFQLTVGSNEKLIGFHGVWREVVNGGVEYKVIPKGDADAAFLNSTKGLNLVGWNSTLAYYSAPTGEYQDFLFPVYVYNATAQFGNETVAIRNALFPATEFGIKRYSSCTTGRFVATHRDKDPEEKTVQRRRDLGPKLRFRSDRSGGLNRRGPRDDAAWEFGTEWLGEPYGLSNTQANAQGFRDMLLGDRRTTWRSRFDWGNSLVWESDFNANDDIWVDDVDFLFYTGHANGNGWVANTPGSTFVDFSIVGTTPQTPGDRWGEKDLEWLAIGACGPHQDDRIVAGGGNAFDRWRGAFDGLHVFLGYATITYDTDQEGRRLAKYAQEGKTIVQAWFKQAKEVQSGDIWVTAMWATTPGNDAGSDKLPGYGTVVNDPTTSNGQTRWLMWSKV